MNAKFLSFLDTLAVPIQRLRFYNPSVRQILTAGGYTAPGHDYLTPIQERIFHRVTHRSDNEPIDLPVYVSATITFGNLRLRSDYEQAAVNTAMNRMDIIHRTSTNRGDENGHLLAASLGGSNEITNFVPQAFRQNRGDFWGRMERYIRNFLTLNQNGSINWQLAILYHPVLASYRPIGFCVEITTTDNNNRVQNISFCFANENSSVNDNDFSCAFDMQDYYPD